MKNINQRMGHLWGLIIFVLFGLFFIFDVSQDVDDAVPLGHVWHEVLLFIMAMIGAVWQFRLITVKKAEVSLIQKELLQTKEDYLSWKKKSRNSAQEIREMIGQQLEDWKLSVSEKDVALLLIKGLSMKEIATLRNTHEKTVRQQATTIYRKANVSGRQELSAFFLEDILSLP